VIGSRTAADRQLSGDPPIVVAQQRFRAMVDAGKGPLATRLSKGRLLFRDDALAAWLAERGMRLVA
jgi:hypothetical protein